MEKDEIMRMLKGCIENLTALQLLSESNHHSLVDYGKALEPTIISVEKAISELNHD